MKHTIIGIMLALVVLSFVSCSSEPEWADPEAHEKTEQLREQYTPLIVGTWHIEKISDKQRVFEQLTFNENGTLVGIRKWQSRDLVTIDGEERYTDWKDIELSGSFTGTWSLKWERNIAGVGENRITLYAKFDDESIEYVAYSCNALIDKPDESTLCFQGQWQNSEGWTTYERGKIEPSF